MECFKIDKDTPIWIYGHGFLGKPLFQKLTSNGYKVKGFIDKNSNNQYKNSYRIISPEETENIDIEDVIIITFQSIREHEKVVEYLLSKGINKIVYLYKNSSLYPKTFDLYNNLVYSDVVNNFEFPITNGNREESNINKLREYGDYIITKIPIQLIFSAILEGPKNSNIKSCRYNVSSIYEYNALMGLYFNREIKDNCFYVERYLKRLHGVGRSVEDFLDDRINLLNFMQREFEETGLMFFWNAPAHAKYIIENSMFEIYDGHHRAVFLSWIGLNFIPIRINKNDYEKWINEFWAKECKNYLEKNEIKLLYTPILHPLFNDIPVETEKKGALVATSLNLFFNEKNLKDFTLLDLNANIGYYSRLFYRLGIKNIYAIEKRKILSDLFMLINRLAYIDNIKINEKFKNNCFDIVLICNDIIELDEDIVCEYIKNCKKYLVIELEKTNSSNIVKDKIFLLGNFKKNKIINKNVKKGKQYEVIVYEK